MREHFNSQRNQEIINTRDISVLAEDIWVLVYSKPYASGQKRVIHGMAHVVRAAILGAAGYNLMHAAGVEGIDALSDAERAEEIWLIQVALLLHDSGAESDSKDVHDNDNALNVYDYLTQRLGISPGKAKKVAEATRNKDWKPGDTYYQLQINFKGNAYFKEILKFQNNPPIYPDIERLRLAIQYGDGVDYLRTHNPFDIQYLQLYQKYPKNSLITSTTEKLLNEERRLCEAFRDEMKTLRKNPNCNGIEAYQFSREQMKADISSDIKEPNAPLLTYLYNEGVSAKLDTDPLTQKPIETGDKIIDSFHTFQPLQKRAICFRGINNPTEQHVRAYDSKAYGDVTRGGYERYKIDRKRGEKTKTAKENAYEKEGNPLRSFSFAAPGAMVFTGVGFGILMDSDHITLESAKAKDAGTGYGKKEIFQRKKASGTEESSTLEDDVEHIQKLINQGGGDQEHTELTGTIRGYDAVFYTVDETFSSQDKDASSLRLLEAIFLRDEVLFETKKQLDIYEFSCTRGYIAKKTITPELIIESFKKSVLFVLEEMVLDPKNSDFHTIFDTPCMELINNFMGKSSKRLDHYYDAEFKEKLEKELEAFDAEKNKRLRNFIEKAAPKGGMVLEGHLDSWVNILRQVSREEPIDSDGKIILATFNSLFTYQNRRFSPINRVNALYEISNKNVEHQDLVKNIFFEWLRSPKNNMIPYNRLTEFCLIVSKLNLISSENETKILMLLESGIDDYIRGRAANGYDFNQISIQDLFGDDYNQFSDRLKEHIKDYFLKQKDLFNFYRSKNSTVDYGAHDKTHQIPNANKTPHVSIATIESLIDDLNKNNISEIKKQLLLLVQQVDENSVEKLKDILEKLKGIDSEFKKTAWKFELLYSAMQANNKVTMPLLAKNAIVGVSEAIAFAKYIDLKNMSFEAIEFISDKIDKKGKAAFKETLLCRAARFRNLTLVEALLSGDHRQSYINHKSLCFQSLFFDEPYTALDFAIEAMELERDPLLKQRWFNVIDDLFKSGADIQYYKNPENLSPHQNKVYYARLLHYILLRQPYPLKENQSYDEVQQYMQWCFKCHHIPGLASVIQSGDFLKIISDQHPEKLKENQSIAIRDFYFSESSEFSVDEDSWENTFPSGFPIFEKVMYQDMSAFFNLKLTDHDNFYVADIEKQHDASLSDTMKSWLIRYAIKEPDLASALIYLQFQLCEKREEIKNCVIHQENLLEDIVDFFYQNNIYPAFKGVLSHITKILIGNDAGIFIKKINLLNQLREMNILVEATPQEAMQKHDINNISIGENGIYIAMIYKSQDDKIVYIDFSSPQFRALVNNINRNTISDYNYNREKWEELLTKLGENLRKQIQPDAISQLKTPVEIVAFYENLIKSQDILPSGAAPLFSRTPSPSSATLMALKKQVFMLAQQSGDPRKFFENNYGFLFNLLNHQGKAVPNIRHWSDSESELSSKPSTSAAKLARTFYSHRSSKADLKHALNELEKMTGIQPPRTHQSESPQKSTKSSDRSSP